MILATHSNETVELRNIGCLEPKSSQDDPLTRAGRRCYFDVGY
jgi:hypothetical protein